MDEFSGLALLALSVFVLYFIIRLAVYHGVRDAQKSQASEDSSPV